MKYFVLGFIAAWITALDDAAVHIPLQSAVAKTWKGKLAFSVGFILAVGLAVCMAMLFAPLLKAVPGFKILSGVVLIVLATLIHLDVFVHEGRKKVEKKIKKISWRRLAEVFGVGFTASFATVIDDVLVYTPLFAVGQTWMVFAGIMSAIITEVIFIWWAADYVKKLSYKEEIASLGLVVFGLLMLTGVI